MLNIPLDRLRTLPTPCLVVDIAAADRNIQLAARYFADRSVKLRPHFKAHKCTELLRRQLAAGSCVGVTCATAWEATVLAAGGFDDILVANQVVDPPGLEQLARAARVARVAVSVDDLAHVNLLSRTATAYGVRLGVIIEVDVGAERCGLKPGDAQLVQIAERVSADRSLSFLGLLGYEGHAVLKEERAERRNLVQRAAMILRDERERLRSAGFDCTIVSGGGTGTFDLATEAGALTEVEAGSYVLMDARYSRLDLPFESALYCCATVISHTRAERAVLNAGLKALSAEYGMATATRAGLTMLRLADEHAVIAVEPGTALEVGESVLLIPAHIDPTINLHDVLFAWDGDRFVTWQVDGRRREAAALLT